MKEKINELKDLLGKLNLEEIKHIDLLLSFTEEDIKKGTDLNYQVTPVFERLQNLSMIYAYLDDFEITEIFSITQTNFFSKIYYISQLSYQLLERFMMQSTLHPVLATTLDFEDIVKFQGICLESLDIVNRVLNFINEKEEPKDAIELDSRENTISLLISTYFDRMKNSYQTLFEQTIPMLKKAVCMGNYQQTFNILSNYIDLKMELLSGLNKNSILYLTDICMQLHQLLDAETVEYICDRIEQDGKNNISDELDAREYLNLLILLFENRYHRLQSCKFYYNADLLEVNSYKQRCKKI